MRNEYRAEDERQMKILEEHLSKLEELEKTKASITAHAVAADMFSYSLWQDA